MLNKNGNQSQKVTPRDNTVRKRVRDLILLQWYLDKDHFLLRPVVIYMDHCGHRLGQCSVFSN